MTSAGKAEKVDILLWLLCMVIPVAWGCRQPMVLELEQLPDMHFRTARKILKARQKNNLPEQAVTGLVKPVATEPVIGDPGSSPHIALVKTRGGWFILHENARMAPLKWPTNLPAPDGTPDLVAFLHHPTLRLYGFAENHLLEIDPQSRTMKKIASLPEKTFCGFGPNWMEHLHGETDFGWDPEKRGPCLKLGEGSEESTMQVTLFHDPQTGSHELVCSGAKDSSASTPRPCRPVPVVPPKVALPPSIRLDASSCAIRIDGVLDRLSLFAEEDTSAPCIIEYEGKTIDGHVIFCVRDPDVEATGRRCVFLDPDRNRRLSVSISAPAETPLPISADARVVLAAGQLLLFNGAGVRIMDLPGDSILTR